MADDDPCHAHTQKVATGRSLPRGERRQAWPPCQERSEKEVHPGRHHPKQVGRGPEPEGPARDQRASRQHLPGNSRNEKPRRHHEESQFGPRGLRLRDRALQPVGEDRRRDRGERNASFRISVLHRDGFDRCLARLKASGRFFKPTDAGGVRIAAEPSDYSECPKMEMSSPIRRPYQRAATEAPKFRCLAGRFRAEDVWLAGTRWMTLHASRSAEDLSDWGIEPVPISHARDNEAQTAETASRSQTICVPSGCVPSGHQ